MCLSICTLSNSSIWLLLSNSIWMMLLDWLQYLHLQAGGNGSSCNIILTTKYSSAEINCLRSWLSRHQELHKMRVNVANDGCVQHSPSFIVSGIDDVFHIEDFPAYQLLHKLNMSAQSLKSRSLGLGTAIWRKVSPALFVEVTNEGDATIKASTTDDWPL